jgi:hypothetical protein
MDTEEKKLDKLNWIKDFRDPFPWTMGLAGMLKWLRWQPKDLLGVKIGDLEVFDCGEQQYLTLSEFSDIAVEEILISLKELGLFTEEIPEADVKAKLLDKLNQRQPKWTSPEAAQYSLRTRKEDYLNKEFDVFLSLLPDSVLTAFFRNVFDDERNVPASRWNVIGNGHEFPKATDIAYMQMDTLAVGVVEEKIDSLVAIELKIDKKLEGEQILKYCMMFADLVAQEKLPKNTSFNLLALMPKVDVSKEDLRKDALKAIDAIFDTWKRCRWHSKEDTEILKERIREQLPFVECMLEDKSFGFEIVSWQKFGEYFEKTLATNTNGEMYEKLVSGFLDSLKCKVSRKLKQETLYKKS